MQLSWLAISSYKVETPTIRIYSSQDPEVLSSDETEYQKWKIEECQEIIYVLLRKISI